MPMLGLRHLGKHIASPLLRNIAKRLLNPSSREPLSTVITPVNNCRKHSFIGSKLREINQVLGNRYFHRRNCILVSSPQSLAIQPFEERKYESRRKPINTVDETLT